jgi:hypothetical protein
VLFGVAFLGHREGRLGEDEGVGLGVQLEDCSDILGQVGGHDCFSMAFLRVLVM